MTADLGPKSPDLPDGANAPHLPSAVSQGSSEVARDSLCELLGIVVHDLANPLQSMSMQLELLREDPIQGTEQLRRIDSMLDATDEFGRLLSNLSGYFQRPSRQPSSCALRQSMTRLDALMSQRLAQRGIAWTAVNTDLPPIPNPCTLLELFVLRILIAVGYARRGVTHRQLTLRSTTLLREPLASPSPAKLRVRFELVSPTQESLPVLSPDQLHNIARDAERCAPVCSIQSASDASLVLDIDLPPSPRPDGPTD